MKNILELGDENLTTENLVWASEEQQGKIKVVLKDGAWKKRVEKSCDFLNKKWSRGETVYGVTTGYGDSCTVEIPQDLVEQLPHQLFTFHGCGMGKFLTPEQTRAVLLVRLKSLMNGYSGVRPLLLDRLVLLLNENALPLIPEEGSVGASGDLTPLSYIAAVLAGERKILWQGKTCEAKDFYEDQGIEPLKLAPKEALAIMNGTSVMTALACFAHSSADYLSKLSTKISVVMVESVLGNRDHFRQELFALKPHPGQARVAERMYADLAYREQCSKTRLQDRYSLRCAPHIIGVLEDSLAFLKGLIETEMNSSNDNPLIDGDAEEVYHGGHFYGGHIAFAMDSLKNLVANISDLMDRQIALLMDARINNGLSANLSGAPQERSFINHGLKAVQIACSAWTAEALKNTMPASCFSRSTECHNQDKVSMGTIASRDALRVIELTAQVAAACSIASCQALELRFRQDELELEKLTENVQQFYKEVREVSAFIDEDRALDSELNQLCTIIKNRTLTLGWG
ncbi:MAG: aromatic amino acid ammonia-lyase [Lentisphaeraceae bacterium]|nr:aromatic amino acid ammonia-lyase [Lentisphaeraceae bacterium]